MVVCRQLHRDSSVVFAGYRIPHPLEYQMVIKVNVQVCMVYSLGWLLVPVLMF
jgi:DNA-directed RNA polymerase subunit L